MRNLLVIGALVLSTVAASASQPDTAPNAALTGDYVEARTASVFAGPCHYNGELTTAGRDAEMAWLVTSGSRDGISLTGVSAIAAVSSVSNLKDAQASRRSVIYIDSKATGAQADAMAAALRSQYAAALGTVTAVKRVAISFKRDGENYRVEAPGITHLSVDAMPNHECCKQPSLVWYSPLVTIENRRVGYTRTSGIEDKTAGALWTRDGQNTAFYGRFTL